MIKVAAVILAMFPVMAQAWDTPQQAVEAFVRWEVAGGRLSSDSEGTEKHVHLEPDYGGIGADTVLVSDAFRIGKLRCKGDRCQVTVEWNLPANTGGYEAIGNGKRARTERVTYAVLTIDGDWRIDSRTLTDFPIISPQALDAHMAMLHDESEASSDTE